MDPIIETLLQTGAIGIIAYCLIQYQREQAQAHREALKSLLLQTAQAQDNQAREHREEMRALIESNNAAFNNVAAMLQEFIKELDALEDTIIALSQGVTQGQHLAPRHDLLGKSGSDPPLPGASHSPTPKEG